MYQDVKSDYNAELTGTGNRSGYLKLKSIRVFLLIKPTTFENNRTRSSLSR